MRIRALIVRICRQFLHDRRTLAMMFVAPLLILTLMSLVFNGETYKPRLAAVQLPEPVSALLEQAGAEVTAVDAAEAGRQLRDGEADASVTVADNRLHITLEGSNPSKTKSVLLIVQHAFANAVSGPAPAIDYLHGSGELVPFDSFGPVLIGVFAFFFVFIIGGVAFLRERTGGTLERLMVSPLKRAEIVLGYVCGFGIFTLLQAGLIVWFSIDILGMFMVGSIGYVLLVTALLSLTALSLGILLSSFAGNEFQMIQFIPLVIVPQVFFCGLFPLETISEWLRWVSYAMPLTYGAEALRDVMVRGGQWRDIAENVYILAGFTVLFILMNMLALKKYKHV